MSTPSAFTALTPAEWRAVGAEGQSPGPGLDRDGLIPAAEVAAIYAPFAHLLGRQRRGGESFLIGIGGAVSVGKSTAADLIRALLAEGPDHPQVGLVSTDGFLYPNAELEARGLLNQKGYPSSYDVDGLVRFLGELKSGQPEVSAPVYSHLVYDVVANQQQVFHSPDMMILEGVNILSLADLLDYSVYIDADEVDIEHWYVQRFLALCQSGRDEAGSFYHHFAGMSTEQIERLAERVWRDLNGPNLRENILPTRQRADLILEKGPDHAVRQIWMRNR